MCCLKGALDPVSSLSDPLCVGAVGSTIKLFVVLNSVAYDAASTTKARRGKGLNGALETVERIGVPRLDDVERFVVSVMAHSTGSHRAPTSLVVGPNLFRLRLKGTELCSGWG
jgi:hypothetical protein